MKKSLVTIAMFAAFLSFKTTANAQVSQGGLPLSKQGGVSLSMEVPTHKLVNPLATAEDLSKARALNEVEGNLDVAYLTQADVKFPESGVFEFLPNGSIVWKTKIVIEGAPAIGTYFDKFDLPKGVSMYMYNGNGSQILGAYTIENVSVEDKLFAVQAVQGNILNIELNIVEGVDLNTIGLSIDRAAVYFEGISYLEQYDSRNADNGVFIDADPFGLQGRGATCHMDAACYTGNHFEIARKASLQMIIARGNTLSGFCSAAMINSLGNSAADCKNYVLTASHCQSNSSGYGDTTNAAFSQFLFRYNFEKKVCNSNERAQVDVLSGANLIARSPYDNRVPAWQMDGDFMLLQLRAKVPTAYNSILAGWDIGTQPAYTQASGQRYIGFHHPSGDIKKVSFHNRVVNSGDHYIMRLPADASQGAVYQGTSGSSVFNNNNRIIGIASTASGGMTECPTNTYTDLNYYKLTSGYTFNPANPKQNLKVWLDPNNTGATTAPPASTQQCEALSVLEAGEDLSNAIQVYPNPSNNGIINVKFGFEKKQNIVLEVYNVLGAKITDINVNNVNNSSYTLDLSSYNSGVYIIKCSNGTDFVTKKVTIAK